ncbi:hypothetical protein ACFQPA_00035 [Halomarina halobia]|uniref:hypothetical protein n=1 Tax=Halomarina halobia TaxID=3033386 RepID=UPI0023E8A2EB|nr:hypothetical protein [Halomarina sp. PSR21]
MAFGAVLAGALVPGTVPPGPSGVLVILGLAGALAGELRDAAAPAEALVAFGALALVAAGVPTLAAQFPLWQTASGTAVVVAIVAYALYRYELVRLRLVEVDA